MSISPKNLATTRSLSTKDLSATMDMSMDSFPIQISQPLDQSSRYRFYELLGSGGFGSVFRAIDTWTGEEVAIKIGRANRVHDLYQQLNELHILQSIGFRCSENHIVCLLDYYFQGSSPSRQLVIVMQYVPGSNLHNFEFGPTPGFHRAELLEVATQLFEAIRFLHNQNICHRDIKPANLIWHENNLTLVDFGIACHLHQCSGKSGTEKYIWPRLLYETPTESMYKASDLYAAARTILELEKKSHASNVFQESMPTFVLSRIMKKVMREPERMTAGRVLQRLRVLWFQL